MHFQDQAHILMRYRVIVTPIVNMVINVDLGPLDLNVLIRMPRQGLKRRLFETFERVEPIAEHLFERFAIQLLQKFFNTGIQLRQWAEPAVPKTRQDPALDDLYRHLHLGLILRTARTGQQYYNAIMLRPLLITWIQLRIVTADFAHGRSEIVANHDLAAATKEIDHPGMACQLVEPRLPPTCLGISIVGCAKHAENICA